MCAPVRIIADISGNHNGDKFAACKLIYLAAKAGCDYVKFQFYRVEDMPDRHILDNRIMYEKLKVPEDWLPLLFDQAKRCGIPLFASVFSVWAVKRLLEFDIPYVKIASPDSTRLTDDTYKAIYDEIPIHIPKIISGPPKNWLPFYIRNIRRMICPLGHPPSPEDILDACCRLGLEFKGYSDHTPGLAAPILAMENGATFIEKHIKLNEDCVDAAFSADYQTFQQLCRIAHGRG